MCKNSKRLVLLGKQLSKVKTPSNLIKLLPQLSDLTNLTKRVQHIRTYDTLLRQLAPKATFKDCDWFDFTESRDLGSRYAISIYSENKVLLSKLLVFFGASATQLKQVNQGIKYFEAEESWNARAIVPMRKLADAIILEQGEFFSTRLTIGYLRSMPNFIKAEAHKWGI